MPLPNLLIVGAQKSGTTWLHYALKRSRQLFGSSPKELGFFNGKMAPDDLAAYRNQFPATPGVSFYYESTPHYYRLPREDVDIAARIAGTLDRPRVIVMFRDPVDRYESAYVHHAMRGRVPVVEEISELRDEHGLLELGRYASITEHWQSLGFETRYILFDDLADKPAVIGETMQWLGLLNDIATDKLDLEYNTSRSKATKLGWRTIPRLAAPARRKLAAFYRDEVARLERLIGRDLSMWQSRI